VADCHWFTLLSQDAELLKLVLLQSDSPADGGEGVRLLELEGGLDEPTFGDQPDEPWDIDIDGAAGDAVGFFALDAAFGLGDRGLLDAARGRFIKICNPARRARMSVFFVHSCSFTA
jgi:hypothetical protein